jgi:hypothetical protein
LRDDIVHSYDEGAGSRVLIPPSLRIEILQSLHSEYQGVNGMNERAKACVYWPGITRDIENIGAACNSCNRNMPSNPKPNRTYRLLYTVQSSCLRLFRLSWPSLSSHSRQTDRMVRSIPHSCWNERRRI